MIKSFGFQFNFNEAQDSVPFSERISIATFDINFNLNFRVIHHSLNCETAFESDRKYAHNAFRAK